MKEQLIMVHGALGSADQLNNLANELKEDYDILNLELPGHGNSPLNGEFCIISFCEYILSNMRIHNMDRANFFGYSMGGYIGLMLAHRYPGKIRKLITYGTKLDWNSGIAAQEIKMLDPETIENKVPAFAKLLSERHQSAGWKNLLHHTATLMLELGTEGEKASPFPGIEIPVLLMLGDRDKMVSLTETDRLYRQFKAGQLAVLPSHPHAIEKTDPSLLAEIIRRFLK